MEKFDAFVERHMYSFCFGVLFGVGIAFVRFA